MSEKMKKIYYTPSNPGSLGGKKRLKEAVLKDTGVRLTNKEVSDWLAGEDAYTLHRTAPIKYKRNRILSMALICNTRLMKLICQLMPS